jgi:hypothetical protein
LPHDLEIATVNGGESRSQYHTPLAVAKFRGKRKKINSGYFVATPHAFWGRISPCLQVFFFLNYVRTFILEEACLKTETDPDHKT